MGPLLDEKIFASTILFEILTKSFEAFDSESLHCTKQHFYEASEDCGKIHERLLGGGDKKKKSREEMKNKTEKLQRRKVKNTSGEE